MSPFSLWISVEGVRDKRWQRDSLAAESGRVWQRVERERMQMEMGNFLFCIKTITLQVVDQLISTQRVIIVNMQYYKTIVFFFQ